MQGNKANKLKENKNSTQKLLFNTKDRKEQNKNEIKRR